MANISDTKGYLIIRRKTIQKSPMKVYQFLKTLDDDFYFITPLQDIALTFNEALIAEDGITLPFYGEGRWTFLNTLTHFFSFLSKQNDSLLSLFNSPSDMLSFCFVDFEKGSGQFYEAEISLFAEWENGEPQTRISYERISDIPITAENLVDYSIYETAYDKTNCGSLLDNETFISELATNIPQEVITVDFLKKAWEELSLDPLDDYQVQEFVPDFVQYYNSSIKNI